MTMIVFLGAFVLGVIVSNLIEEAFSDDWLYHKEYERFLHERGNWGDSALWAVP